MKISVTVKWQVGDRSGERTAEAEIADYPLGSDDELNNQIQGTVGALLTGIYDNEPAPVVC